MSEAGEGVARVLEQAIRAELDGHSFYLMAARSTLDVKGREVFEQLAQEELVSSHSLGAKRLDVVIPAEAGIQAVAENAGILDPRLRGGDGLEVEPPRMNEKIQELGHLRFLEAQKLSW